MVLSVLTINVVAIKTQFKISYYKDTKNSEIGTEMVLKISKELLGVSNGSFRTFTDYQVFTIICFRKGMLIFRKMRYRPHRKESR